MARRAAIVGVGGLGAPAAVALASVGASLSLFDPDRVELSNLPRQPLFGTNDVGDAKASCAARRLRQRHPGLDVVASPVLVDRGNAADLLVGHDVIVDATDGLEAKALLNAVAVEIGVPLIHAGVLGLDGQLMTILPRQTACLRCLFVDLPAADDLASCQQAGILGPVAGAIGLAAAREAHAVLLDDPAPLAGRLAILDGTALRWRQLELRRNSRCPTCS